MGLRKRCADVFQIALALVTGPCLTSSVEMMDS